MMTKLWASFYKEFLLIARDRAGVVMLFVMPLCLIIIMAIIMDAPFRDYQQSGIDLVLANDDADTLGNIIERGLKKTEIFNVVTEIDGSPIKSDGVERLIKDGDYILAVVIPSGATQYVNNRVASMVNQTLAQFGIAEEKKGLATNENARPSIQVYLDPAVKRSFANTILSSLKSFTTQVENRLIIDGFYAQMTEDDNPEDRKMKAGIIGFEEIYPSGNFDDGENYFTNSVQHNVPAWSVFAMFLIVVPLASNMIKERDGGSMLRLMVAPGPYMVLLLGKLLFYVVICMVQFSLMLLIGLYAMPYFGLPALIIGSNFMAIFLVALMVSLAATSFGVLIGTVFNSYQQASIFGTVIDVIMAAIGGIMVPLFAMPDIMKMVGGITPLNWGMESFNDLFLRGAGMKEVLPEILLLLGFSALMLVIAWGYNKKNKVV